MSRPPRITRRQFARSAAAAASFAIVPRHVLGGPGYVPPSDTLTMAVIGVGGMGREHLRYPGAVLRAVCDVDRAHLASALEIAGPGVSGHHDFREVLERPDIDVVHIATPPHWHALMSVATAEAGKDVWCEKPMTRTIAEGRAVRRAVERNGRVFRINTWFRFEDRFYDFGADVKPIRKAVQGGLLGWPIKGHASALGHEVVGVARSDSAGKDVLADGGARTVVAPRLRAHHRGHRSTLFRPAVLP